MRTLKVCSVVTVVVSLIASVPVAGAPSRAPFDVTEYDGATLLQGVFFGQGPVAALFPEIHGPGLWQESADDRMASFFTHLSATHPGLLDDFRRAMLSGDHVEIDEMLQQTGRVLAESAASFTDGSRSAVRLRDWRKFPGFAAVVNLLTGLNVVVLVNIIYAVNVYIGVTLAMEIVWTSDFPEGAWNIDDSRLRGDYFVSLIAERLSVA